VDIAHDFTLQRPVAEVWPVLTDLPTVAQAIPGASLEDVESDGTHKGRLRIKLGSVSASFGGTARYTHLDAAAREFTLEGSGQSHQGTATLTVRGRLAEDGSGTRVALTSTVSLSGALAQFGSGMADQVIRQLLDAFVRNLQSGFEQGPDAQQAGRPPADSAQTAGEGAVGQGQGTPAATGTWRGAATEALDITPGLPPLGRLARPALAGAAIFLLGVLVGRRRPGRSLAAPQVVYLALPDLLPRHERATNL